MTGYHGYRGTFSAAVMAFLSVVALVVAGCGAAGPDLTPPATPTGFQFDRAGSGDGQIKFTWNANHESDLAGYYLYRTQDDSTNPYTRIATLPPDSTSYTDSGLDYTIQFYYRLSAFDRSGNESQPTGWVLAIAANLTAPAPPTNVHAAAQNLVLPASITVSWSPNTEGDFAKYLVFRGTTPNISTGGTPIDTVLKGTTSFVDTTVVVGSTYYYRVVAEDKGGLKSSPSTEVSDTPLTPPSLSAPVNGGNANSLIPQFSWSPVPAATGYKVFVYDDVGGVNQRWSLYVASGTTTSATYAGPALTHGTQYYWRVAASTLGEAQPNSISAIWSFTAP